MTYYHLTAKGKLLLTSLPFINVFPNIYNHFLFINGDKPMLPFENLYRELMRLNLTEKVTVNVNKDNTVTFKTCCDTYKVDYDFALNSLRMQVPHCDENFVLEELFFVLENYVD